MMSWRGTGSCGPRRRCCKRWGAGPVERHPRRPGCRCAGCGVRGVAPITSTTCRQRPMGGSGIAACPPGADITSGTVSTARLGTGAANATTFCGATRRGRRLVVARRCLRRSSTLKGDVIVGDSGTRGVDVWRSGLTVRCSPSSAAETVRHSGRQQLGGDNSYQTGRRLASLEACGGNDPVKFSARISTGSGDDEPLHGSTATVDRLLDVCRANPAGTLSDVPGGVRLAVRRRTSITAPTTGVGSCRPVTASRDDRCHVGGDRCGHGVGVDRGLFRSRCSVRTIAT